MENPEMIRVWRPEFFKIFLPRLSSERLKIPKGFLKHMEGETSGCVTLKGPSGYTWNVELIQKNDDLFLQDGWPVFLSDHSVDIGDFLVFRYDGNFNFTVRIFDRTACEKEAAFSAKCSQGTKGFIINKGKKRKREKEVEILDGFPKRVNGISTQIHSKRVTKNIKPKEEDLDENGCKKIDVLAFKSHKESPRPNTSKKHGIRFPSPQSNEFSENKTEKRRIGVKKIYQSIHELGTSAFASKNGHRTIEERVANSFASNVPYFVKFIPQHSVATSFTLVIPTWFCKAYLPRYKTEIVLRCKKGESWIVNLIPDANSCKFAFCGGWTAFVRENNIKEADICIFELVGKLEMHVHILLGRKIFCQSLRSSADFAQLSQSVAWKGKSGRGFPSFQSNEFSENKTEVVTKRRIEMKKISQSIQELDASAFTSRSKTWHKTIEERVSHYFASNVPYFVRFICQYSVVTSRTLIIPTWFCKAHLPRCKAQVVLWSNKGKSWNVNLVPDANLCKYTFSGGWNSFVHENNIKEADICIFELVGKLEMHVHIILGRKIFRQPLRTSADFAHLSQSIARKGKADKPKPNYKMKREKTRSSMESFSRRYA